MGESCMQITHFFGNALISNITWNQNTPTNDENVIHLLPEYVCDSDILFSSSSDAG